MRPPDRWVDEGGREAKYGEGTVAEAKKYEPHEE